ncbi:MAG: HAD family phosphatase [Anaerolineae bacterium]|nr:HAD family phosphatase [Anaerolineae bacterium]
MKFPILVSDLDGTLVDHQGNIHPADVALLAAQKLPARLILATGRSLGSVRATFSRHNLFLKNPLPFAMVLHNGAVGLLPEEKLVHYAHFDAALQKHLVEVLRHFDRITTLFFHQDDCYFMYLTPFGVQAAELYGYHPMPLTAQASQLPFSKIMCISDSPPLLDEVSQQVRHLPAGNSYSMPTIFELAPPGVNKASGLKALLKALGCEGLPLFIAGDGGNDLEMLQMAEVSFSPQTSPLEIRQMVDRVIDTSQCGLLKPMLAAAGITDRVVS